jgi:hypothetical protein
MNRFSGLVVKLAVAKRSSECSVSASPVFDSRLMHAFVATLSSLRFSGLVVKLAVAIWVTLRAASASPVFDSRLMQVSFCTCAHMNSHLCLSVAWWFWRRWLYKALCIILLRGTEHAREIWGIFSPCSTLTQSNRFFLNDLHTGSYRGGTEIIHSCYHPPHPRSTLEMFATWERGGGCLV